MLIFIKKRTFAYFYSLYKRRKEARRIFRFALCFLRKGWYYLPEPNLFRKINKKDASIKTWFIALFYNLYNGEDGDNELLSDHIKFGVGEGKIVLMTTNTAYGFYNTLELYLRAKANYERNYSQFNYPVCKILGFNDEKRLIVMERVLGNINRDFAHDNIIVRQLLICLLTGVRRKNKDNQVLFLQHGDAKRENIIWDLDSFCFVDLDNIQFLPPLFDVFHYLNNCNYNLHDIVSFISQNSELLQRICVKSNIDYNNNPLDTLLYKYIRQYMDWGIYYNDFKFLTIENTNGYPLTHGLLINLTNSQNP